jgi:glucose-6-phosphate dehydrogenase assembly protein OpcA
MDQLLRAGIDVAFADIEAAQGRLREDRRGRAPAPALIATVVVVGGREQLAPAADALTRLSATAGVRTILIASGTETAPAVRVADQGILLDGLKPAFLNNAVAALRLSSLPTLVWWRGGAPDLLDGLASLADRLVLDAEDPRPFWPRVSHLAEETAVSDLRWTRLTRWRALIAHFFDSPDLRAAAPSFRTLRIAAADVHAARLFAGWLVSSLNRTGMSIAIQHVPEQAAIESISLADGAQQLTLRLAASRACVAASATVRGHAGASRTVSLGDQSLAALMAEELRIRSRDLTFERALAAAESVA